jgi:peptide/nickel transport system permease protein
MISTPAGSVGILVPADGPRPGIPSRHPRGMSVIGRLRRGRPSTPWLDRIGLVLAVAAIVVGIFGPTLAPDNADSLSFLTKLTSPSAHHVLGTDSAGRDILSRILVGGRATLGAVLFVVVFALVVGVVIGTLAGLVGGLIDQVLMRLVDIGLSFPALLMALGVAAALGPSLHSAEIAVAARLVRSVVVETKHREFVVAARELGMSRSRVVVRHLLPNALDTLFVQATVDVAAVILTIAGLSFIGVGAQPPQPEWGAMIADGQTYITTAWWASVFPGLAIMLTALGFSLTGDWLRIRLDPRLRAV